jgi:CRISPR-associated protein Csb2
MPRPNGKSVLVLDPFVRTDGTQIQIVWDHVELAIDQHALLEQLLESVGYIGRAESPCIIRTTEAPRSADIAIDPFLAETPPPDGDVIRVLCLVDDVTSEGLSESSAQRRKNRLATPPCGRWISYSRPGPPLHPPRPKPVMPGARSVIGLRFAVQGPAVPPLTDALRLAERYRAAVLRRADASPPDSVLRLRGRRDGVAPLEGHVHAHYLVTDEDGDRRIDHLTVWCPAGLEDAELRALDLPTLRSWAFDHPVQLVLLDELRAGSPDGPAAEGRRWRSHTPFLPIRHPKRRGGRLVDTWDDQLRLELERRDLPQPQAVELMRVGPAAWGAFRRVRDGREPRAGLPALGFEIEFAEPVCGPISLGRNSHFGMGLFLPADKRRGPRGGSSRTSQARPTR